MSDTSEKKTYLINIESNLKKYADEAVEAKKKVDELTIANIKLQASDKATAAEKEASKAALKNANAEYTKAQKMVQLQVAANSSETGSRKQLNEILTLQMQALGKLGKAYVTNAQGIRELNPLYIEQRKRIAETKQQIIDYDLALNDGRSNVGRYGESVKTAMHSAGQGFSELSSAVGGVVGEVGNVISSFLTAGGVVGLLSAAVGILAKAWKTTQENVKLYLETADKAMLGAAGFEQDAENARKEARKRGEGQFAEGLRLSGEYQGYLLRQKDLTEEQRKYYQEMVKTGDQMVINGRRIVTDTYGIKNKIEWERKYNTLLLEQEQLADKKLEKETEWEALEADLIKQRAIVSSQESTSAEKKQAAVDADIIANKLVKDKTYLLDMELANLQAIAEMTGLQEKYEDQINGMLKERNTIQKEYFSDQVKINRLTKATTDKNATPESIAKVGFDIIKVDIDNIELKNLQVHKDIKNDELQFNKKIAAQNDRLIEESARISRWEADQYVLDLDIKRQAAISGLSSIASILGEQTELGKGFAIAAATIDTFGAAAKALNDPTIPSTIARIALMTSVILAGIANVKQIMSVKVGKGGVNSVPSAISSSIPAQRTYANQAGSTILTQQQLSQNQLNAMPNQNLLTADDIARALSKMPAPKVSVEDINARIKETNKVSVRGDI